MNSINLKDLIVIFLFCIIVRAALTTVMTGKGGDLSYLELAIQGCSDLLLFSVCALHFKLGRERMAALFGKKPNLIYAAVSIVCALGLVMFSLGENAIEAWFLSQFDNAAAYHFWNFHEQRIEYGAFWSLPVLAYLFITTLVGPLVEEFFFRALLLRSLAQTQGFHAAAVLSSIAFAAMHFSSHYFLSTFVFSLSLCYIYLVSRSLLMCAMVHSAHNLAAFVHQDYFDIHWTRSLSEMGSLADWIPELAMLAISVSAMVASFVFYRRRVSELVGHFSLGASSARVQSK